MPIQILRTAIENEHPLVSRLIVFSDPTGSQEPDVGSGEAGRSLGPVSAAVVRVALAKREGPGGPVPLRTIARLARPRRRVHLSFGQCVRAETLDSTSCSLDVAEPQIPLLPWTAPIAPS